MQLNESQEKKNNISAILERAYELRSHNLPESIALAEDALSQSEEIEDTALIAESLTKLALFHMVRGEYDDSLSMSQQAITHLKVLEDEKGIADAKYNLAGVYYRINNYHLGMMNLLDCLATYKKFDDPYNISKTQKTLGTIHEFLGDSVNATAAYKDAVANAKRAKNKNLESNAYNPLSGILLKTNQPLEAMTLIEASISIKEETGDLRGLAFALYGRGKVHTYNKDYEEAEKDFHDAIDIHIKMGEVLGTGMAYNKMGQLWILMGKRQEAIDIQKKASVLSDKHNLLLLKHKCNHFLYQIYKEDKNDAEALKYLEKYLEGKDAAVNSHTIKIIENYELISKMKTQENEAILQREKAEMLLNQKRVEEASKMKQEFLSAMSHEIRTPLNAVTSIISLLEERSSKREQKLLTSLRFSSKNLLRIINDILDFSKLDSNMMTLDKHPVVFYELLNNILETYVGLAKEKGLTLKVKIGPDVGNSYTLDETKLFQILGNLVSNAIKFTDIGEVDIIVDLIESSAKEDHIQFKVVDTGIGIPKDEMQRLFESFYMPRAITTRADGGTGLGLAIVKKLVELHGSSIQIDSTEGKGSEFSFDLKLEKSAAPLKANPEFFDRLMNKTAILAEDNEINAIVMRELLKKWGVTIKRVKNGREAVAVAKEEMVDFILMDIHMPEMNGFDAAQLIRTEKNPNQFVPIFALTADITSRNDEKHSGYFNGFLWKPIQIERLFEALVRAYDAPVPFLSSLQSE